LWRAGLVELLSSYTSTAEELQRERERIAHRQADPAAAYQKYKAFMAQYDMPDEFGSLEAYVAAKCTEAHWKPEVRVTRVRITAAGRALVNCARTSKLTDSAAPGDKTVWSRANQSQDVNGEDVARLEDRMNDWLTAKEAAAYAKTSVQAIYLGVKRKKLRAARVNGQQHLRFLAEWIDAWLLANATIDIVNPEAPGDELAAGRRH
jgi:excisionase family DNA binding protein